MYVRFISKYLRGFGDYSKSILKGGLGLAHGLGTCFGHMVCCIPWYCPVKGGLGLAHGLGTWFEHMVCCIPWYCPMVLHVMKPL